MTKTHDEIHAEMFDRINHLETKVDETNGYLRGVVESNERLIKLFAKSLYILAFIATACLFALIYGAIGKEGLHSVRKTLPTIPQTTDALPTHNDFDKWKKHCKLGLT